MTINEKVLGWISKRKVKIDINYIHIGILYLITMSICMFLPWVIKHLSGLTTISFIEHYEAVANISDVNQYIRIAEDGYVTTGDERLSLVFFPFYPLVIRVVNTIMGIGYRESATLISLCSGFSSAVMLYKIARIDYDRDKAFNIVKFFYIFPFTFFIYTRMSESLYLFLLFTTIYFIRKRKYIKSGVFGFMTAFTRLPGLAVGVVMIVESIYELYNDIKHKSVRLSLCAKQLAMMLLTLSGFLTYLGINYKLYGTPFKFLEYQSSHWSQRFTNPYYVVKDVLIGTQLKGGYPLNIKVGCGVAGLIAVVFIIIAILIAILMKVRTSYIIYTVVYFIVCYSASWLLSGGRYSVGAFLVFMVAGLLASKNKYIDTLLTIIMSTIMLFFSFVCSIGGMY